MKGESGDYVFERRAATSDRPFVGLKGVFGAVTLPQDKTPLNEKVRRRLAEAAIERGDADDPWAVRAFRTVPGRFVTFESGDR